MLSSHTRYVRTQQYSVHARAAEPCRRCARPESAWNAGSRGGWRLSCRAPCHTGISTRKRGDAPTIYEQQYDVLLVQGNTTCWSHRWLVICAVNELTTFPRGTLSSRGVDTLTHHMSTHTYKLQPCPRLLLVLGNEQLLTARPVQAVLQHKC